MTYEPTSDGDFQSYEQALRDLELSEANQARLDSMVTELE